MRLFMFFLLFMMAGVCTQAQKSHYDSIREMMQQDSIEYEQQLHDADWIKNQTDSILKKNLGHIESITPGRDSATVIKNLRTLAAVELKKQQEEETKNYYFFVAACLVLVVTVIFLIKRKQFREEDNKNHKQT